MGGGGGCGLRLFAANKASLVTYKEPFAPSEHVSAKGSLLAARKPEPHYEQ